MNIIMESNILNPTYKELIAIEKYRNNNTGRIYSSKHTNNWLKAIISIFAVSMLLGMMGVPIYNGVVALEDNAIPYQLGNSLETSTATGGHMGDIIAYELWHWGKIPTAQAIGQMIAGALIDLGLTYLLSAQEITTISITIVTYLFDDGTSVTVVDLAIDSTALVSPGVAEALAIGIIAA
jgi:hypothetical protein